MAAEYLADAANNMYNLLTVEPTTLDNLTSAATLGCNALTRLASDPEFRMSVEELTRRQRLDIRSFISITGRAKEPLGHFLFFLREEKRVMLNGGLDTRLVDEIIRQVEELIESIRQWKGDATTLLVIVARVRDDACTLKSELVNKQKHAEDIATLKKRLLRITYAVAGGAIIILVQPRGNSAGLYKQVGGPL